MAHPFLTIGLSFLGSVMAAGAGTAQMRAPRELDVRGAARSSLHVVFEGIVLAPDGTPAEGAVVTSSAGGRAVTDQRGRYRLAADVPLAARVVHITASDGTDASHSASMRFEPASSGVSRVEPLQLVPVTCQPRWIPTFGQPELIGTAYALVTFDDGSGSKLYAGGGFSGADSLVRWDGSRWEAIDSGLNSSVVHALVVFDDGGGPALYAGGGFAGSGYVARWDGSSWSELGSGLDGAVHTLAVFDDGNGPALYAGGSFTAAGGVAANRIARWDGSSWAALASGVGDRFGLGGVPISVLSLVGHDDGSGPALYVGGEYTLAGSVITNGLAKWDGSTWAAVPGWEMQRNGTASVRALAVYGPSLVVGGLFYLAGGVAQHIARWNGTYWFALGSGLSIGAAVHALMVHNDGTGAALYVGGFFTTAGGVAALGVARWKGGQWSALGTGVDGRVHALRLYDDGGGSSLYAGGELESTGGSVTSNALVKWDGSVWSTVGRPTNWLNGAVVAQTVHDDGGGSELYAGGHFSVAGSVSANRVAKWDGTSWSALGTGIGGPFGPVVNALTEHDDGSGPKLYAGGNFSTAGSVTAHNIAKWNGTSWSALGSGTNDEVLCMAVYDDGGGPALFAGGWFSQAGGMMVNQIAKWNGASWTGLSGGVDDTVWAMTVYDDGSGPSLHVASGERSWLNGYLPHRISKWDGSTWSTLVEVSGASPIIDAMTVHDDGSGPSLYIGGSFTEVGGVSANGIARWDGSSWSTLGSGLDDGALALTVFDDGSRPALYAGGYFTTAGGTAANRIARWDGSSWTPLGSGLSDGVFSLVGQDSGRLRGLYAGGYFAAPDSGDGPMAKWGCVPVASGSKVRRR